MWSNKYIGIEYKFGSRNLKEGSDCLRLVEEIYRREKGFEIKEDGEPVVEDWYEQNPERLIREAVKRGDVITDITKLREFDAVFFKMKGVIRHVGVMIDNYGKFLHQLELRKSRVDNLGARHWRKRFYCGIRPKFTK